MMLVTWKNLEIFKRIRLLNNKIDNTTTAANPNPAPSKICDPSALNEAAVRKNASSTPSRITAMKARKNKTDLFSLNTALFTSV